MATNSSAPTSIKTTSAQDTFAMEPLKEDSIAGNIYHFSGEKNLDLFYKHDPEDYFSNIVCFWPIHPKELTYPSGLNDYGKSGNYCQEVTPELLHSLNRDDIETVINTQGDRTQDYFTGSVNALVSGYTIDTRGMETYNKIYIKKINEVY